MRILFSSLLVLLLTSAGLSAAPEIEFNEGEYVFGKVVQRSKIVHDFWVKSVGDEPLRITKIVPGCGCTQVPLKDSVIAPGDSTKLTLYFETRNYRGNVTKRPYFLTNASNSKNYIRIYSEVLVKPELDTPLVISPYKVDVSQFTEKSRRRARFSITNKSKRSFAISVVDPGHGNFKLKMPEKVGAGETVEGTIIVHKEKVPTSFEDSITFYIDDDLSTRYTIAVRRLYQPKPTEAP